MDAVYLYRERQYVGRGTGSTSRWLRKTFGDGETAVTAIDDISFEIESGTVVGILGPNGAGKTTTIK